MRRRRISAGLETRSAAMADAIIILLGTGAILGMAAYAWLCERI